jgi:hypothetical protein
VVGEQPSLMINRSARVDFTLQVSLKDRVSRVLPRLKLSKRVDRQTGVGLWRERVTMAKDEGPGGPRKTRSSLLKELEGARASANRVSGDFKLVSTIVVSSSVV